MSNDSSSPIFYLKNIKFEYLAVAVQLSFNFGMNQPKYLAINFILTFTIKYLEFFKELINGLPSLVGLSITTQKFIHEIPWVHTEKEH